MSMHCTSIPVWAKANFSCRKKMPIFLTYKVQYKLYNGTNKNSHHQKTPYFHNSPTAVYKFCEVWSQQI